MPLLHTQTRSHMRKIIQIVNEIRNKINLLMYKGRENKNI